MKPVLLFLTPTPPQGHWPSWHSVWCAPPGAQGKASTDETVRLSGTTCPLLCQGLLACAGYSPDVGLLLLTHHDTESVTLPPSGDRVKVWLTGPDEGTIYFPRIGQFWVCAQAAIQEHNPGRGKVTLTDVGHQSTLSGWGDPLQRL